MSKVDETKMLPWEIAMMRTCQTDARFAPIKNCWTFYRIVFPGYPDHVLRRNALVVDDEIEGEYERWHDEIARVVDAVALRWLLAEFDATARTAMIASMQSIVHQMPCAVVNVKTSITVKLEIAIRGLSTVPDGVVHDDDELSVASGASDVWEEV